VYRQYLLSIGKMVIDMKKIYNATFLLLAAIAALSCGNDELTPVYVAQFPGKIVIRSYNALNDSIQVSTNGQLLEIDNYDTFKGDISKDYEFVFYEDQAKNIDIINKVTGEVLKSYSFTEEQPIDTLSFYAKDGIWLEDVLSFQPGVLSGTGRTGYRFIFPTMNRYSNSGYDGPLDAIIKKSNGQVLGTAENITRESFSTFVEFAYAPPPILNIELVKHGTTEPYIAGQPVIVQAVMQNNKSRLIVLDEKADGNGAFTGVEGSVNLVDYFYF
jgi:hypothetical protein